MAQPSRSDALPGHVGSTGARAEQSNDHGTPTPTTDKIIAVTNRDYFHSLTVDLLEPAIAEFRLGIQ